MDPDNSIVLLCVKGMRYEGEGRYEDARAQFVQAWDESTDDFEACIAAHYLARHQDTNEQRLQWNQESLRRAQAAGGQRVQDFYPSLYLNLGYSYEQLGEKAKASYYYELAENSAAKLSEDRYGKIVRDGIEEARRRL
jgi:tetratricopeptide (TPR) repeat protein